MLKGVFAFSPQKMFPIAPLNTQVQSAVAQFETISNEMYVGLETTSQIWISIASWNHSKHTYPQNHHVFDQSTHPVRVSTLFT